MYYLLAEKVKYYPANDVIEIEKASKKLEPQVSQLLQLFLQDPQHVCSKEFILEQIWQGRIVTDDSVRVVIRKLRDVLGDDSKAPIFIKTMPRHGYQLICEVRCVTPKSLPIFLTDLRFFSSVLLFCFLIGYLSLSSENQDNDVLQDANSSQKKLLEKNSIVDFQLTELTQLPGSEVSPDYDDNAQRLIFSYRESQEDLMALYVKDLQTETIQKLTHDDYNYVNAHWINDGEALIYTRFIGDESQHFSADYKPSLGLINAQPLPLELNSWFLKSAGFGNQLIFSSYTTPRSLAVWQTTSRQLKRITAPEQGEGDVHGVVSANGTKLAVLRILGPEQQQLLVIDLKTGSVLLEQALSIRAYKLIWQENDSALLIGDFFGNLLRFDALTSKFSNIDLRRSNINNVFFDCGKNCFFARQHNGNYLDVVEQKNPFSEASNQPMINISSAGIEDFPVYGKDQSVYFAQTQQSETWLMKKAPGKKPDHLYLLPQDGELQALSINENASHLTGKLGQRIFYFDLTTSDFQWLSGKLTEQAFPHFTDKGKVIQFVSMRNGILQLNKFNLLTNKITSYTEEKQWSYLLNQTSVNRIIYIDAQNLLWLEDEDNQKQLLLTLRSSSPNRFKMMNDWLYFIERIGNTAYLSRLSMTTFEIEQSELAKNRLRLNFDISADGARVLGVNSVSAQSNLVKVQLR